MKAHQLQKYTVYPTHSYYIQKCVRLSKHMEHALFLMHPHANKNNHYTR